LKLRAKLRSKTNLVGSLIGPGKSSREHFPRYIISTAKTCWFVKTLIAQALVNVKVEQQDIFHALRIFEGKFEVVCGVVFGVKITIMKAPEEAHKGKREMGSTSSDWHKGQSN
jgi:hypothetical protein